MLQEAPRIALDERLKLEKKSLADTRRPLVAAKGVVRLAVHKNLAAIEHEWRAFEQVADCTVFQSFDWLSTWQQNVGNFHRIVPAIITGRDSYGRLLFIFPLGVKSTGFVRLLTWLGTDLCDYNGPLLAPDFSQRREVADFARLWSEVTALLGSDQGLRFDIIYLEKMQATVGTQPNPFVGLGVMPHADRAYLTFLSADWEKFYADKRSPATRRRDRTKKKRLSELGEVRHVHPEQPAELVATLTTLMEQKSIAFAARGVADIFAKVEHRNFYIALIALRDFVHVSRLDIGTKIGAVNLGLIFRGSYYHLLASYDCGEVSKFGPGAAHMRDIFRYAIDRECRVFDFTIGDESYKQDWCDKQITLYNHISTVTFRGYPTALWIYTTGVLKRWIKQTPTLRKFAYMLRTATGRLRIWPRAT